MWLTLHCNVAQICEDMICFKIVIPKDELIKKKISLSVLLFLIRIIWVKKHCKNQSVYSYNAEYSLILSMAGGRGVFLTHTIHILFAFLMGKHTIFKLLDFSKKSKNEINEKFKITIFFYLTPRRI